MEYRWVLDREQRGMAEGSCHRRGCFAEATARAGGHDVCEEHYADGIEDPTPEYVEAQYADDPDNGGIE